MRRPVLLTLAALGTAGLAAAFLLRLPFSPASPLQASAAAYRRLGQALLRAGLLPFPADRAALQDTLHRLPGGLPLTPTTDSNGQPVWQLGQPLTVLTHPGGGAARYLLHLGHAPELGSTELARACQAVGRLSLTQQHPAQITGGPAYAGQFYFNFSALGHSWRFTPTFAGERCVRVDVEETQ